jgi:putative transposase
MVPVRCALIDAKKAVGPVAWMCLMLGVPRSSFYARGDQADKAIAARRRAPAVHIEGIFTDRRGATGVHH